MTVTADMTTPVPAPEEEGAKSRKPIIIALLLFLLCAGAGFSATFSGMVSAGMLIGADDANHADVAPAHNTDFAFVPVGEMVIPLGPNTKSQFLIIESEVEVAPDDAEALSAQMPRVRDMFNTYLRAVEASDLEAQDATVHLRDALLRRIRVVADPVVPRDLLFSSFVLK